jgi:GNAT superfamily N-acetyltransferase
MLWRLPPKTYAAGKKAGNRNALRRIVTAGPAPGIIAYTGARPVGWCAVAPRTAYPHLERSRVLRRVDSESVWSVSCLFVHKDYRRQGVATALIRAAAQFAHRQGAAVVEGYPVVPHTDAMPAVFAWTGTLANFIGAGFVEVARRSATRPIMRHQRERRG